MKSTSLKKAREKKADFDIQIISGGIYGCGIAQAVSACGYKTLLIEQKQIASGTSSLSTKLINIVLIMVVIIINFHD